MASVWILALLLLLLLQQILSSAVLLPNTSGCLWSYEPGWQPGFNHDNG
jgi:hypothetical protein